MHPNYIEAILFKSHCLLCGVCVCGGAPVFRLVFNHCGFFRSSTIDPKRNEIIFNLTTHSHTHIPYGCYSGPYYC